MNTRLIEIEKEILPLPNKVSTIRMRGVGICNVFESHNNILICIHPSSNSYDGEFRKGVIKLEQFNHYYDKHLRLLDQIEEQLDFSNGVQVSLEFKIISNGTVEEFIDNTRLPIRALAVNLLINIDRIKKKYTPNYYNPKHIELLEWLYDIIQLPIINSSELHQIYNDFTVYKKDYVGYVDEMYCICQKILPLSLYHTENKLYKLNEDMRISNKLRQLILAGDSNSLPFMFGTSDFYELSPDFYENDNIQDKFKQSEVAEHMLNRIEEIDQKTYEKNDKLKVFINKYFKEFSGKLDNVVVFIKSNLIYVDIGLCIFTNYMGRTLGDIPIAHRIASEGLDIPPSLIPLIDILRTPKNFKLCLFQVLHNLLQLEKLDIIHGDLHFNNLTIRDIHKQDRYKVGNKMYNLGDVSFQIGMIDFSRGIMESDNNKTLIIDAIYHYVEKINAKYYSINKSKLSELSFSKLFAIGRLWDYMYVLKSFYTLDLSELNSALIYKNIKSEIKSEIVALESYIHLIITQPSDKHVIQKYITNNYSSYISTSPHEQV